MRKILCSFRRERNWININNNSFYGNGQKLLSSISQQKQISDTGMNCKHCGKPVKEFDDFILVGKYPTRGQMWKWSEAGYYVRPENYGTIYHKKCFVSELNKKNAQPSEVK